MSDRQGITAEETRKANVSIPLLLARSFRLADSRQNSVYEWLSVVHRGSAVYTHADLQSVV